MSGSAVKKPRLTKEEKTNCMQNGQLRTSCSSMVIHQFWKQFVIDIDIGGFVSNMSSPRAKRRTCPRRLVRITPKNQKQNKKRDGNRDSDDRLRDLPEWFEEFTDRGRSTACTRTNFSGLRFGTSCESGIKIKEAQYSYSLPRRPKLRSLFANQNDKGSLQKTHWRSSASSRKVW